LAKQQKRLTRKEIREDKVSEFVLGVVAYAREHSRRIWGVALVVLIIAGVSMLVVRQRRAAELEGQGMLANANLYLKDGNYSGALQAYAGVMERFRGTWSFSDATFLSGAASFDAGRYDSALVFFESYLDQKKRRDIFNVSAQLGIAQCLEELGRYTEAADSYLKVQREHPEDPIAADALFGAGRAYQLAGDLKQAESAYQDLITRYPESRQANLAKMPLLEIQAKLENT